MAALSSSLVCYDLKCRGEGETHSTFLTIEDVQVNKESNENVTFDGQSILVMGQVLCKTLF